MVWHLRSPITSLFMVRNIKYVYSFSKLHVKLSRLREIFCFATKSHCLQQLHLKNAAKYGIKLVG